MSKVNVIGVDLTNITATVNDVVIKYHDKLDIGSTITFTPDDGYELTENGTVKIYNAYGMSHDETISKDTGTYTVPDGTSRISFTMTATKKADTPEEPTPDTH